jgi:large conductance mechanosensitive channel
VVIGGAFGKIVSALVDKIIMPIIGFLTSGVDFKDLTVALQAPVGSLPPVVLGYGSFLQSCLDFIIVAFTIFLVVKAMNRMMRKAPPTPAAPTTDQKLLMEIRDLLKKKK